MSKKEPKKKPERQRRVQTRAVATREAILSAAAELIAKNGIHNLKANEVAKLAKIPPALLSYHYPSTDVLMHDLMMVELDKLKVASLAALEMHPNNPELALYEYVRAPFVTAKKDKVFQSIWTYFYHLSATQPKFTELNLLIRRTGRERILALVSLILEKQKSDKKQTIGLMPLTLIIQGIITGFIIMAATESKESDGAIFDEYAEAAVKAVGKALKP